MDDFILLTDGKRTVFMDYFSSLIDHLKRFAVTFTSSHTQSHSAATSRFFGVNFKGSVSCPRTFWYAARGSGERTVCLKNTDKSDGVALGHGTRTCSQVNNPELSMGHVDCQSKHTIH